MLTFDEIWRKAEERWPDRPIRRQGRQIRVGKKGSIAIEAEGEKAGLWFDYEAGEGGSLLTKERRNLSRGSSRPRLFPYRKINGDLEGVVVRDEEPDGTKNFRQISVGDDHSLQPKAPEGGFHPYNSDKLATLPSHAVIVVVEGEKAADAINEGHVRRELDALRAEAEAKGQRFPMVLAMTAAGGARNIPKADWTCLKGRDVVLWPDNDEASQKCMQLLQKELSNVGAARIRKVEIPSCAPEKWDAGDHETKSPLTAKDQARLIFDAEEISGAYNDSPLISAIALQSMKFEPIDWVVSDYICEGLTLFAGKPKIGKSWLGLDIAIAVARGGYTLGDKLCKGGNVLYAALEDNKRRLQRRMRKLCGSAAWPENLSFVTEMPLLDAGGVDWLKRWLKQVKSPRLIIIDTLAKVRSPKGKNDSIYEADYKCLSELKKLADDFGVAIIVAHHVRKQSADDPLDTVSGTTGLTGAVDTTIVLNRDNNGVTLYARGRDIEEVEDAVSFNRRTCRWELLGAASEVRRSDERTRILKVLAESPEAMTPGEIADETGASGTSVRQMLRRMAHDGEVEKEGRGRYRSIERPSSHNGHDVTIPRQEQSAGEQPPSTDNL